MTCDTFCVRSLLAKSAYPEQLLHVKKQLSDQGRHFLILSRSQNIFFPITANSSVSLQARLSQRVSSQDLAQTQNFYLKC